MSIRTNRGDILKAYKIVENGGKTEVGMEQSVGRRPYQTFVWLTNQLSETKNSCF